jgi:aryl-alcohol dehydrogenase-like predicted oxidoreductase
MEMRSVELGDTGMRCSVLGFGCAPLMGRVGRRASLAALSAAYDAGISFFDTARSYGYGEAEALLGEFLQGRRHHVILSTKFGIVPSRSGGLKRIVKPMARTLLQVYPPARSMMQGVLTAQTTGGQFNVATMQQSVEASLRALRTDYVDLLFLHEPAADVLTHEDLMRALEALVRQGKVRSFGVSAELEVAQAALRMGVKAVQVRCDGFEKRRLGRVDASAIVVGNHPFGGVSGAIRCRKFLQAMATDDRTPQVLREKLQGFDDAVLADVVLNVAASAGGIQVVVPSMTHVGHVSSNVAAMQRSRFDMEEIRWLRQTFVNAQ